MPQPKSWITATCTVPAATTTDSGEPPPAAPRFHLLDFGVAAVFRGAVYFMILPVVWSGPQSLH